jgi:hypothetical protein
VVSTRIPGKQEPPNRQSGRIETSYGNFAECTGTLCADFRGSGNQVGSLRIDVHVWSGFRHARPEQHVPANECHMTTRIVLWIPSVAIVVLTLRPFLFHGNDDVARIRMPLAVATQSDRAVFDIACGPCEAVGEWLMVVGCLGHPLDEYSVHLSADAITECELKPFEPGCADNNGKFQSRRACQNRSERITDAGPKLSVNCILTADGFSDARFERRRFSIHVTDGSLQDPRHYVTVVARLAAIGNRVRVFVDEQVGPDEIAHGLLEQLVSEFDDGVVSRLEREYGTVSDVDKDGRFAVLLSPWLSKLQGGTVSLNGFVRSSDFQPNRPAPFSNRSDLLYLNSNLTPGPEFTTLLAHEFTHAIICDRRSRSGSGDEDDWLNEGLAHLSETQFSSSLSNLDHRVARFYNDPSRYPLAVHDYYSAGLWRDHGCRGATWSFMNRLQNRFGRELVAALIDSDRSGINNVERATGVAFADLFRDWSVSVFDPTASGCSTGADNAVRTQWRSCGPSVNSWDPRQNLSLTIRGTAFTGIRVSRSGRYRIKVSADCGASLQVSLVPMRRTHNVNVSAFISNSSEVIVTVVGDGIRGVTGLALEDHTTARSRLTHVSDPALIELDSPADGVQVFAICSDFGIRNQAKGLQRLTVKAVIETTDGRELCVRCRVASNGKGNGKGDWYQ